MATPIGPTATNPPNAPPPAGRPQPMVVHLVQRSWAGRLFGWLGWMGFVFCLIALFGIMARFQDYFDTTPGLEEKFHSGEAFSTEKIAIIEIDGVIMEGDGFVKKQIDRIRKDDDVKAVLIRVNSPGGTVTGSDFIYHHLKKLREERNLPMVVSMGSMAASGGYYVAMAVGGQEKSIYAEPTTTTGSIGVIIPHYDISGLLADWNVKDDSIATHPRKQMLSMTKPMSEEERQLIKEYIEDSFERFTSIVKEGRPAFSKDEASLEALATGEVFTATQAKKNGLIDEIGFIEDALERLAEIAKLDLSETRVVKYEREVTLADVMGVGGSARAQANPLGELLELASPKAWYLATSLPALITSRRAD